MADIYFPSCRVRNYSPEKSKQLETYLQERHGLVIENCCRTNHKNLQAEDTAVYICNTCAAIIRENAPANPAISVWELLAIDTNFPYPNYQGQQITIQDCWRVYDNLPQQKAVRAILKRLNFTVLEIEKNFATTDFCGTTLWAKLPPQNAALAPQRFLKNAQDKFKEHSIAEQKQIMQEHCQQFRTDNVVCYCVPCANGLNLGGAIAVHLLDLIFK